MRKIKLAKLNYIGVQCVYEYESAAGKQISVAGTKTYEIIYALEIKIKTVVSYVLTNAVRSHL
jgi:hypothetical protein